MAVADQLLIKVSADVKQAQASMLALDQTVGASTKSMAAKMAGVGAAIGKAFFVVGAGAAIGSIKAFATFESEMTKSMAIMGDEAGQWRAAMETAAREVGKTTLFSASEAAEAYFFLASAGMSAEQQIAAMPQVAKFAQAGMFDLALATDLATDAQSALGLTVKDPIQNLANLTRVTDVFVKANTLANTSVEQIATAMTTKAAAAGRKFGMSIEETASVLLVMADAGVKGATAGTQFSMMLNNITGNAEKNSAAFEAVGIAVFDSTGNMRNMSDIVKDMTGAFAGMSDEAAVAAMGQLGFGDKAKGVLAVLQGSGEAMAGYQEALESATGFADDVAAKQLLSFESQLSLLKSQFVDIGLTIGSVLVPMLTKLVEFLIPLIDKSAKWAESNKELATNITLVAAAVYPFFKLIKFLNPWVVAIAVVIFAAKKAMDHFGISIDDLLGWFKALIGYFKDVVTEGDYLSNNLEYLPEPIRGFIQAIGELLVKGKAMFEKIVAYILDHTDEMTAMFFKIRDTIIDVWNKVWEFLEPLVTMLVNFFTEEIGGMVSWFKDIFPVLKEVVMKVLTTIWKIWKRIWSIIQKYIQPVFAAILKIISGVLGVIKGVIKFALNLITGNWSEAWEGLKDTFKGVWKAIVGILELGWLALKLVFTTAGAALASMWDVLWIFIGDGVKAAWEGIKSFVASGINGLLGLIENMVNDVVGIINGMIDLMNKIPGIDIGNISELNLPTVTLGVDSSGAELMQARAGRDVASLMDAAGATAAASATAMMSSGVSIGTIVTSASDPIAVAEEVGWELMKRGA